MAVHPAWDGLSGRTIRSDSTSMQASRCAATDPSGRGCFMPSAIWRNGSATAIARMALASTAGSGACKSPLAGLFFEPTGKQHLPTFNPIALVTVQEFLLAGKLSRQQAEDANSGFGQYLRADVFQNRSQCLRNVTRVLRIHLHGRRIAIRPLANRQTNQFLSILGMAIGGFRPRQRAWLSPPSWRLHNRFPQQHVHGTLQQRPSYVFFWSWRPSAQSFFPVGAWGFLGIGQ